MKYVFKNKSYLIIISFIDFLGYFLTFPFKLFQAKKPQNVKNILLVRLDHIGDFVSTTPLFENIKTHFHHARLTVIINPAVKVLAERNRYIDEVILFKAPWFDRNAKKFNTSDFFGLIKHIRREKFDLGIDPRGDFFSIILMFLGKVKYKAGYGITGGGFLLDSEAKYNKNTPAVDRNLNVLSILNIPVKNSLTGVYFNNDDKNFVDNLLENLKYTGQKAIIIHANSGTKAKQWPEEKFRELIRKLQLDGYSIFLIGTKDDIGNYSDIYDLRERLSLTQLTYFMKRIGFFVGLDSGPANIAAALNINTVVICSGTNIAEHWIPQNSKVSFIHEDVACKPCELIDCKYKEHYCMEQISVDKVLKNINEMENR